MTLNDPLMAIFDLWEAINSRRGPITFLRVGQRKFIDISRSSEPYMYFMILDQVQT